jgi:hypothetical protein
MKYYIFRTDLYETDLEKQRTHIRKEIYKLFPTFFSGEGLIDSVSRKKIPQFNIINLLCFLTKTSFLFLMKAVLDNYSRPVRRISFTVY